MRFIYFVLFLIFFSETVYTQTDHPSTLQEEKQFYDQYHFTTEQQWDNLREQLDGLHTKVDFSINRTANCTLDNKRVFGWHPYWNGSTVYNNYQWNLLSDLCYFDYTITPATGANSNASFAWSTSATVTAAKNNGVKISFCATLFSGHSTFLTSATAKQTFINNVISLLQSRGGNGVCLDFEAMGSSNKTNFTAFVQDLSTQLKTAIPGAEVSMAIYAVDWNSVFDIANLKNYVDLFIIMGYDYYYGGSATAGPTDPLFNFETGYNYDLSKSVTYYLKQGVPGEKLLLAVPYYGRQWQTAAGTIPSATMGNSSTPTFRTVKLNSSGNYSNKQWDNNSFTPYFSFQSSGNWYQCFMNDSTSMAKRFDLVNQRGIGGIGIWALGYDDGYADFWNTIRDKFSSCKLAICSDSIFDMGGPSRNYYDNENYTYTITPPGNVITTLNFSEFDLESNYDSLWIYDGLNTNSPLIGGYSGTNSPGTVTASGASLTLRFKSDGATVRPGFKAIYSCSPADIYPPTTSIILPTWVSGNFNTHFIDAD